MGSRSFGEKRKLLISAVLALHLSTHIVSLDFDAVQFITLYTMIVIFVSLWVKAQCVPIQMKAIDQHFHVVLFFAESGSDSQTCG